MCNKLAGLEYPANVILGDGGGVNEVKTNPIELIFRYKFFDCWAKNRA